MDILKQVERASKAGYTPDEIADFMADQSGIDAAAARKSGYTSEEIIQGIAFPGTTDRRAPVDPYKGAERGDMRRNFIPLGAAMMAPIQGVQQMFGNEQAGAQAIEAQQGIERNIPGGRGGMMAGKAGVTSALMAPAAPIGAAGVGARGVLTRALATGGSLAAAESLQPMAADQSRAMESAKAGATGLIASPTIEGVMRGGAALAQGGKELIAPVVQKLAQRFTAQGVQPSGAAIEQEIILSLRAQGVDYAKLDKDMKQQILTMTRDALRPENLSQNALVRAARVEQTIGVPATRGQAERSTELMRNEQQFGGEAIMQREAAQNDALSGSLERLATRRGGALDPRIQGESFRTATMAREADADRAISDAYKLADETVGDVPVSVDGLAEIIQKNPLVPGVDTIAAKLKKAGVKFDENGDLIAGQSIPAKYMGEIRKIASQMTQSPERAGIGKSTKDAIDDTFAESSIPQYAEAVSRARAGFRQFADREIPAGILATRKGIEDIKSTDRLADWVMAKSPEQLRDLKHFFARGNEQKLREFYGNETVRSGVQAVKDLKAAAIGAVLNKGLRKSATAEGGTWTTSPEALVTSYMKFGGGTGPAALARADEKMRVILGPRDFAEFKQIMQVAEDLSVPGRAMMKGSADANTGLAMRIMGLLGMSPAAGMEAAGAVRGVAQSVSAKKSAQWSAKEQAKAMRRPVLPQKAVNAAARTGSLATLMSNE